MKKFLLFLVFISGCGFINTTYSHSQEIPKTTIVNNVYVTDLDVALRLSKETKQDIVLVFSASWCGYCKILKNDLPTIEEFDDKIICIVDSDVEKRLTRQFSVKSLPTSIMLNSEGVEISRITGYESKSYKEWLKGKK